ncbi:putative lipoprotein [Actinokineospora spheciospongiae]|uniref:Putative lipoprotein n=1 Tax=Actinokineospora spheciospongiae TaxID=909613 RepID=W7IP66_9PSEU|nr:DUF4349 domain-containing protein [Actinokineospora spheciospongiae]EWC58542.1 putative lipoprotein [Actinokineospora spheciospongiae]
MNTTPRRARRTAGLLLAATALAALASCTSSGESGTSAAVAPERAAQAPAGADAAGSANGGKAAESGPADRQAAQVSAPGVDRKLARTATLELGSDDVVAAAETIRAEVLAAGGYSGQESVSERTASLTLHVPSDKLDAVLAKLTDGGAGTVRNRGQNAEDVTEQTVDVESRIKTQRASLDRVRALLANARSVPEIVEIESEVTRREAELESLLARRDRLAGSVAMSKITVQVVRADAPVVSEPADDNSFLSALAAGWDGFLTAGGFVLRVVGYLLPFAALAAAVGWVVLRLRRRTRAEPPAAPAVPAEG